MRTPLAEASLGNVQNLRTAMHEASSLALPGFQYDDNIAVEPESFKHILRRQRGPKLPPFLGAESATNNGTDQQMVRSRFHNGA